MRDAGLARRCRRRARHGIPSRANTRTAASRSSALRSVVRSANAPQHNQRAMQPLAGTTVADLTRYLPGPFASRELLRLGARVVKIEPPDGDPTATRHPAWYAALNAGKESSAWDARSEPPPAALLEADVVLEGFRPGVWERLGVELPRAHDPLLDHRLRRRRAARRAGRPRPELPRLRRRARGHRARAAARAGRRPRRRRTGCGDRDPRRAARARAHRARRAHRRLDDARLAPARRAPPRRRAGPAPADRRRRLLPHLRDRRRPLPHRRRARAEVLAAALRAARAARPRRPRLRAPSCPSSSELLPDAPARRLARAARARGDVRRPGPLARTRRQRRSHEDSPRLAFALLGIHVGPHRAIPVGYAPAWSPNASGSPS